MTTLLLAATAYERDAGLMLVLSLLALFVGAWALKVVIAWGVADGLATHAENERKRAAGKP